MDVLGTIEAVKAVSEPFCPVTGGEVEINEALEQDPAIINRDPYGEGWMIKPRVKNQAEENQLLDASDKPGPGSKAAEPLRPAAPGSFHCPPYRSPPFGPSGDARGPRHAVPRRPGERGGAGRYPAPSPARAARVPQRATGARCPAGARG